MNSIGKYFFVFFLLLLSGPASFSQSKLASAWSAKFQSPVLWQRVHGLGYLIVNTKDALYGVDPHSGKILWENKSFPGLDPANFNDVEGTEFVSVSYLTEKSARVPMQAILDVLTGRVVFDSQKEKIGVLSKHALPGSGKLLVIGMRPNNLVASLLMYDIASGNQLWVNDDLFKVEDKGKGFLNKLQAMSQELSSLQALTSDPYELDAESLIITHPNYVIRLNSATGKVMWKNSIEASKRAFVFFSPARKDVLYVGTDVESTTGSGFTTSSSASNGTPPTFNYNYYYGFNLQTGAPVWKQPAKEKDMLNVVIAHEKGLIVCPRSADKPTINLINYDNGDMVWGKKGKGVKVDGSVVSYFPTPQGILITTSLGDSGEDYFLNLVDPVTGTLKYPKSVKVKGSFVRGEMTPKGLLFVTSKQVNILDLNTGAFLWSSSIEAGNPFYSDKVRPFPTGDDQKGKMYVYSPKEKAVFEVDKQTGTNKKITTAPIEFEGKEMPKAIDVVADGLVISSDQNVMKLGFDGLLKFYQYYPAPQRSGLMRALLIAESIRAAYASAEASAYSAAFAKAANDTSDPTGKEFGTAMSGAFNQMSNAYFSYSDRAMKAANARFKASRTTPAFVMMMTPSEKRINQLVQVSKSNGKIMNAIDIKNDRDPEYEIDQIYNYVYYKPTPEQIVCYKL